MRVFLASIPLEAAKIVIIGGGEPALAKLRLFLDTPAEVLGFAPAGGPARMETPRMSTLH
jgi:uroporphyrin-III C-methyltransferase/precorrin-2 dehydrogenase/sirohydrochlorin ferrochelatase